ncbi:hypothetical protein FB107DRAFT_276488 [Schizophyllum commune]
MAPSEISLRALRTSCKSLAAYAGERSCGVSATYSSRPTSSSPPLPVLPPPDSRAYYDRSLCEQRELSRKIYAVRDAYNSVLTRTRDDEAPAPRVMTLADMCAAVAGRGLEYQPEDEDDALDWNEERDEIYEAIPPPYRRAAIRSQALDIILTQCPYHPTLLSLLLDATLAHGLACEAPDILRLLLHQAVRPRRAGPASLLHPAHTSFLVDLLRRWTAPSAGRSHNTFVHALLDVMDEDTASDVWSSRAMDKLAREIWRPSLAAFLDLSAGLIYHICNPRYFARDDATTQALETQLRGWLLLAKRYCFRRSMTSTTILGDDSDYCTVRDFLRLVRPMLLHCRTGSTVPQDVLCLAMEWLVAQHALASKSDLDAICSLIRCITPAQDAFQPVVAMPFTDRAFADLLGPVDWLQRVASAFSTRADVLRQYGLVHAEAMLWSGVVGEVERPSSVGAAVKRSSGEEVHRWREQLVSLADEAEARCRGGMSRAEWARENMVDCWDDSRPARKRVKRVHVRQSSFKREAQASYEKRPSAHYGAESPARSRSRGRENKKVVRFRASSDTEGEDEGDEELLPTRDERQICTPRRRFSSILSSALVNMTTVHTPQAKPPRKPARASLPARMQALQPMGPFYATSGGDRRHEKHRWSPSNMSSDDLDVFGADEREACDDEESFEDARPAHPSSDDPLDMFMYATSPVRGP